MPITSSSSLPSSGNSSRVPTSIGNPPISIDNLQSQNPQSPIRSRQSISDVLAAHRHGAHVARRAEPGADDRARHASPGSSDDARRAQGRRAPAAREGGTGPSAAGAEDRDGPDGRVAPVALH